MGCATSDATPAAVPLATDLRPELRPAHPSFGLRVEKSESKTTCDFWDAIVGGVSVSVSASEDRDNYLVQHERNCTNELSLDDYTGTLIVCTVVPAVVSVNSFSSQE
jgi:hypothetical protein